MFPANTPMKLLFCSNVEDMEVLRGLLAETGIQCKVTNDNQPLPGAGFYPTLWVEESDFDTASAVLDSFRKVLTPKLGPWNCPRCRELLEEQFSAC